MPTTTAAPSPVLILAHDAATTLHQLGSLYRADVHRLKRLAARLTKDGAAPRTVRHVLRSADALAALADRFSAGEQ